eukprot:TRINITY_DN14679_c0_g1_i1.p1 TRINITY_DN14679_c0_g1~~TRINITY_DN14679_c0_g1_i1.p1  ORF type:complete len:422 (+),score=87.01 TRINITY_DN14679_c0_g1_i1:193-1458(+)
MAADDGLPLLNSAAGGVAMQAVRTIRTKTGVQESGRSSDPFLGPDDLQLEFGWELGVDRVTLRGSAITHEQCAAMQATTKRTWKTSRTLPLSLLRSVDVVEVQRSFYNATAYRAVCLLAAVTCSILLVIVLVTAFIWWAQGSEYWDRPGGATSVTVVVFFTTVGLIGSIVGYRTAGSGGTQLVALPAETAFQRVCLGPWVPRVGVVIFHGMAFALSTYGAVQHTRKPPFGLSPWCSAVAMLCGIWLLGHGRTRLLPAGRFAGPVAVLLLAACCALGFAAAFVGVDARGCADHANDGFLCRSVGTTCTQDKKGFCDAPVRGVATAQWWTLTVSLFVALPLLLAYTQECTWDADSAVHAELDAPVAVTLQGDPRYGYPLVCHLAESQARQFVAHLAKEHFNGQFRTAALGSFGAVPTVALPSS